MDEFTVSLKILREILEKKKDALTGVLNISVNQEAILSIPPSGERAAFFSETVTEKQNLIDNVLECDSVFQGMFDVMRDSLEDKLSKGGNREKNSGEIKRIQALIKEVTELDVSIRAQELKNNELLAPTLASKKIDLSNRSNPAYRAKILNELNKHKKQ